MKFGRDGMKFWVCLIGLIVACAGHAEETIEVVSVEGSVMAGYSVGNANKPVQSKTILPAKNVMVTGPNARAVIRVGSDGFVVLGNNSQIEIDKSNDHAGLFRHVTGLIYYALNTIKGKDAIKVRTASGTIGVRGTRFLVADIEGRKEVGMRKGLISVSSTDGEFEIHRKAELDEFAAFQNEAKDAIAKEQSAFEEYKANQQQEFIEFKREFNLGAGRMASFDGKRVIDRPLSEETKNDMNSFESYANEWLKAVRD